MMISESAPVVPHPESIAAQTAYIEALLPGSAAAPARIVSRHVTVAQFPVHGSGPNCFHWQAYVC